MGDDPGQAGPARRCLRDGPCPALIRVLRFDDERETKRVHCLEREPKLGTGLALLELADPEPAGANTLTEVGLTETGRQASLPHECADGG